MRKWWQWWDQWRRDPPPPREWKTRERVREIRIIMESKHYVFLRPPSTETTHREILDELEFIRSKGYRPLFPVAGIDVPSAAEGYVCERVRFQECDGQA